MSGSWPLVRLGEVASPVQRPEVPVPGVSYRQLGVRWWGEGAYEREPVDGSVTKYAQFFRAEAGDLVLNKIWARHGSIAIVQPALAGAYGSNEFPMFTLKADRVEPAWLHWLSKTEGLWRQFDEASRGTSGKNRIRPERILDVVLPLPPLHEQQRALKQIAAVAAELEARATVAKAVETEVNALLRSAFARIIANAPRCRMGEVAPLVRRPVAVEPNGSYPELGVRSFGRGLFDKPVLRGVNLTWQNLFRIEEGDLVFSNIKAWEGAFAVADARHHGMVGSHRYLTCVADPSRAIPSFLWFALQSSDGLDQIGNASPGSADRNRTLSQSALGAIKVPLPSLNAQSWFNALQVEAVKARAARMEADAEAAQLLPALLAEIFSGSVPFAAECSLITH